MCPAHRHLEMCSSSRWTNAVSANDGLGKRHMQEASAIGCDCIDALIVPVSKTFCLPP